ncbi:MAG TPA: LysE family transporter, partial [Chitinophagaceae bacterium]|nr:LysE family transporter [Chitinophagaceae bacterium]
MHPLFRIFITGMLVSFVGSLPLGTLNILAMKISIYDGIMAAILFAIGSLLVEVIYVRISLVAMDWVRKQDKLLKTLEWVTLFIVLALAIASFYAALHPGTDGDNGGAPAPPGGDPFPLSGGVCGVKPGGVPSPFWRGAFFFSQK